ncbi:hypothetical protein ACFOZ7_12400 [Natribaculum luteum]|uniref:DUF7344 domain-containing protein n=1 Tax=Natribaculum luteum TaxID=1586232 RepID=A0ABD5P0G0_9EURY|nr:hypothetical protein [Natribaculum luteum]
MSSDVRLDDGGTNRESIFDVDDGIYEVLSNTRRSTLCSLLLECGGELPMETVVRHIVAREAAEPLSEIAPEKRRTVEISLYHQHVPKLADCGVVTWDREAETVALADDAFDRGRLAALLGPGSIQRSETLFELLTHSRRRTVLSVLTERGDVVSTDDLAARIAAAERDVPRDAVPTSERDRVYTTLRHAHLPAMDDAGVLEYDREDELVVYRGHPALLGR